MAITKETLWRAQIDEYACVHLQRVTRITDDEGDSHDRYWRRAITPDADLATLAAGLGIAPAVASRLAAIIDAARYPEAVARYEARKGAL